MLVTPRYCWFLIFLMISASAVSQDYDTDLLTKEFHANRRDEVRKLMNDNSCAVFFSNPERKRANDTKFMYHQDPTFYYLTGLEGPNSMLIIFKEPQVFYDTIRTNELIFVQDRDPAKEVWNGRILGEEGVKVKLGFKYPFLNKQFESFKINFNTFQTVHLLEAVVENKCENNKLVNLKNVFCGRTVSCEKGKLDSNQLPSWVASLREVKQPEELVLLRKAIDITCKAHLEVMRALQPGMYEYQAQAIAEYIFKKNGAEHVGYSSILGGGENSCILHYVTNRKKLQGKNLLVMDAGAEYHGYTADITRTMPVDGKFSTEEKIIYDIVLEAQEAGIKACIAGNEFRAAHKKAVEVITSKLMELKIITKKEDYQKYFFHGTSHYLGLDVHDAGNYGKYQPGNVITVEPGIYIAEGSPCDPKWWNIGIRIEDDILITDAAPEVLSKILPRKTSEIETRMKEESLFNKIN